MDGSEVVQPAWNFQSVGKKSLPRLVIEAHKSQTPERHLVTVFAVSLPISCDIFLWLYLGLSFVREDPEVPLTHI